MSERNPFDDPKVIGALDAPLDKKLTAQRDAFDGKGTKLTYLEGHAAIAQLNRLFGYDAWAYTLDAQGIDEYTDGPVEDWYAQFWAVVTLRVRGAGPRQDVGTAEIQNRKYTDKRTGELKINNNVRKVDARSTARKGAVTDALKRAARTFGQQTGNGLYDTDNDVYAWMMTHSVGDDELDQQAQRQPAPRPAPPTRTATTPAGGVTTAPKGNDDPWNIQAEVREEIAARQATTEPIPFRQSVEGDLRATEEESVASIKERVRLAARESGYTLGTWKEWVQLGIALNHPVPDAANSAALTVAWCRGMLERLQGVTA